MGQTDDNALGGGQGQRNNIGGDGRDVHELSPRLEGVSLGLDNSHSTSGQTATASRGNGRESENRTRGQNVPFWGDRYRPRYVNNRGDDSYRPSRDDYRPRSTQPPTSNLLTRPPSPPIQPRGTKQSWHAPSTTGWQGHQQSYDNQYASKSHSQGDGSQYAAQSQQPNYSAQNSHNQQYNAQQQGQWQNYGDQYNALGQGQQQQQGHYAVQGNYNQNNQPVQFPNSYFSHYSAYPHQPYASTAAPNNVQTEQQLGQWHGHGNQQYSGIGEEQQSQWYGQNLQAQLQAYYAQGTWNQNIPPVPLSAPHHSYYPAYPFQPTVPPALSSHNAYTGQVPSSAVSSGVSLLPQSQEQRAPGVEGRKSNPTALAMHGETRPHLSGWTPVNEQGIASVLLNPKFSSALPSFNQSRTMHTQKSRSRSKSPYKQNSNAKVFTRPVPQPTEQYLKRAALEPCRFFVPHPTKQLLILDLNGTLVHRPDRRHPEKIIPRPFLAPFLQFIFDAFTVMVWSSAQPANVNLMVTKVLGEQYSPELLAKWNRNNFGLTIEEKSQNVQVYKQLTRVWADSRLCGQPSTWGQHNTILLDDTLLKAVAEPYNLIEIPEFTATPEQMKSDVLREVAGYLQELRHQEDVSAFMKRQPFKADGSWNMKWADGLADGGVALDA